MNRNIKIKDSVWLPKTDFPMKAYLQEKELKILEFWNQIGLYQRLREKSKGKPKFILHYGPPYANGAIHTGHALTECLKDIINKTKQMQGFDAPLIPGWDCHGLPIEWKIEENLRKNKKTKNDLPVIDFLKQCRDFAQHWIQVQRQGLMRFGICADWNHYYCTMHPQSEAFIESCLLDIFMKGLLYHGKKPVLWSVVEQTALAEAEVEYKDHVSESIYVMFPIQKASANLQDLVGSFAVIWTTTPWTLPANRAISFNLNFTYALIQVESVDEATQPSTLTGKKLLVASDLLNDFCSKNGITKWTVLRLIFGKDLTGTVCQHPFAQSPRLTAQDQASPFAYDFDVPFIYGNHVTLDAGTGLVHTAPSHGMEDYVVGKAFHIDMPDLVQGDGTYVSNLPLLNDQHIFKIAPLVMDILKEVGLLLSHESITHSYPHSWRSKSPLIYRLTPQWFLNIDQLRDQTLSEIDQVHWFPKQSINRIRGMVSQRPDWCLSRQRVWGVPIALFVNKKTGEPLKDTEANQKIIQTFAKEGIEAWHTHDTDFFLSHRQDAKEYEKVMDTLDVWFDSACTHDFVIKQNPELQWPVDLYLEGYDQHRGWFQSSLIESIATYGKAPYKNVLSHGFILDQEGRKMSKSLGNVLSCDDLIAKYGADITRLWIISTDTSDDVRIGQEIMKRQEDIYRRFRNILRYLLGVLRDFDDTQTVSYSDLPELEKYVLCLLGNLAQQHIQNVTQFDLASFYADLHLFCANDLSAFYFDICKDTLYCDAKSSLQRCSAQTVMKILFDYIVRWLAPVLSFTAEEAWIQYQTQTGKDDQTSIHEQEFLPIVQEWLKFPVQKWEKVRQIRKIITKGLEEARAANIITSSLQAHVDLHLPESEDRSWQSLPLNDIAIVSAVDIHASSISEPKVEISKAQGTKCQRCWKVLPDSQMALFKDIPLCHRCCDIVRSS